MEKVIDIHGRLGNEGPYRKVGILTIAHDDLELLDNPALELIGEDVGLPGVGIRIQSYTANPDRVPE